MPKYNPDILTCLANLSNDEVFTPPVLANKMLDLLPDAVWSDPNLKFLDCSTKTGVFLREIAKRLIKGLEKQIPDLQERLNHIFTKQLFGIGITELTALMARRTLYCSVNPKGQYSICDSFDNNDGNVVYKNIYHTWGRDGLCTYCGVNRENFDRDPSLEQYAYQFIHIDNPAEIFNMNFDIIVSNPPYSMKDGGGRGGDGAKQIFNYFVEQAKKMNPRYLMMVIPARWYSGGKGLDSFRDNMLSDSHISELHDFPDTSDCFPGKNIRGGVCYFKWERNHNGDCRIVNHFGDNEDSMYRPIKEEGCDVFIRSNKAISILQKVLQSGYVRMGEIVSSRNPFQIVNTVICSSTPTAEKNIKLYQQKGRIGFISKEQVGRNDEWIDKYLVITAKASPGGDDYPHSIISAPKISEPGSVCTETFLVIGVFDTQQEAENLISYMRTRFFRFMMFLVRNGQNLTKSTYTFVPNLDYSKSWTDEELYKLFDVKPAEIEYINTMIRPMD